MSTRLWTLSYCMKATKCFTFIPRLIYPGRYYAGREYVSSEVGRARGKPYRHYLMSETEALARASKHNYMPRRSHHLAVKHWYQDWSDR